MPLNQEIRAGCQPNVNVEALRVWMLEHRIEARPLWKPMHRQPVYCTGACRAEVSEGIAACGNIICWEGPLMSAYTLGVEEELFKVGFCLPAGPYVTDGDVRYIVECIREGMVKK